MKMKKQTINDVPKEQVTAFGSTGTSIQWLRKPEESTHFMLRRFEIESMGQIGVHHHPEEHQMFILKGPIILIDGEGNESEVNSDDFVYMPPDYLHGYKNPNDFTVSFLCGIPKLAK